MFPCVTTLYSCSRHGIRNAVDCQHCERTAGPSHHCHRSPHCNAARFLLTRSCHQPPTLHLCHPWWGWSYVWHGFWTSGKADRTSMAIPVRTSHCALLGGAIGRAWDELADLPTDTLWLNVVIMLTCVQRVVFWWLRCVVIMLLCVINGVLYMWCDVFWLLCFLLWWCCGLLWCVVYRWCHCLLTLLGLLHANCLQLER